MIVFRSETLAVRAHLGRNDRRLCFVVFDPMGEDASLDREAFAETFLANYGIDAVHVLSARNDWYQTPALAEALARVRDLTAPYERVATYGSSMGGYAALRFSDRVGADVAIAISPQYSMLPGVAPFERRWTELRDAVRWLYEAPGDPLPSVSEAVLFFDGRSLDGLHAAAVARDLPHSQLVDMPYAGHPAGAMLAELGVLASSVIAAAQGTLALARLTEQLRQERRRSGHYLFTLARRQPMHRLGLKAELARRAMAAAPHSTAYVSYAGLLADHNGDRATALALYASISATGSFGQHDIRYAAALSRAGRFEEAAQALERALLTLPERYLPIALKAVLLCNVAPDTAVWTAAQSPSLGLWRPLAAAAAAATFWLPRTRAFDSLRRRLARRMIKQAVLDRTFISREVFYADGFERDMATFINHGSAA